MKTFCLVLFVGIITLSCVTAEDETTTKPPTVAPATTSVTLLTTPEPNATVLCGKEQDSCENCLRHASCLWCKSSPEGQQCMAYPVGDVIPHKDLCGLSDARWGVCWLNYLALLICMAVLGGIILISCCCCVYCCCCRTNKSKQRRKFQQEDARMERERDERQERRAVRSAERQTKYDDIRKKYGLIKDDNPYQKFDNEA